MGACTGGFIAKKEGTSEYGFLTAGHCFILEGGSGDTWRHGGTAIGPSLQNTWRNGAAADAGYIRILSSSLPSSKNQFISRPTDIVRSLTAVEGSAQQLVGESVCRTGRTSGQTCGTIVVRNVTRQSCLPTGACRDIANQMEVSFDSSGGDSGGPVYWIERGYGIHVHSQADAPGAHGWYSTLGFASAQYWTDWGVRYKFCLNAACTVTSPS